MRLNNKIVATSLLSLALLGSSSAAFASTPVDSQISTNNQTPSIVTPQGLPQKTVSVTKEFMKGDKIPTSIAYTERETGWGGSLKLQEVVFVNNVYKAYYKGTIYQPD
ncbi:hypothetical protein [Paenibacillus polymyxa]|uniref:hypothetical protein n=1 Tax=Paenibacillus polymyxa TaxID=1406 RepID=UPI0007EA2607|nr:hypothetical protein [Paenibacillus polymyxa]OAZ49070.1 hypothetical protein A9Z39_13240 [Paenibacillus polymyxa]